MNKAYTQSTSTSSGCCGKCGCLLQVKLISQLESVMVIIPPVTVFPEYGSLTEYSFSLSIRAEGLQVSVADSHADFSILLQNFSGFPKISDFAARFFHNFHPALCPLVLLSMSIIEQFYYFRRRYLPSWNL